MVTVPAGAGSSILLMPSLANRLLRSVGAAAFPSVIGEIIFFLDIAMLSSFGVVAGALAAEDNGVSTGGWTGGAAVTGETTGGGVETAGAAC